MGRQEMAMVDGLLIPKLNELTLVLNILSTKAALGPSCLSLCLHLQNGD